MAERVHEDPAESIAHPDFPIAVRGYERAAVDLYVQKVVRLVDELDGARSPTAAVRQALDRLGAETAGILAQAHTTADNVTTTARREADERIDRARADAEAIIRDARDRAQALDRDADVIWQERARLLADVQKLSADLQRVVRAAEERFPVEPEPEPEPEPEDEPAAAAGEPAAGPPETAAEAVPPDLDATVELPAPEGEPRPPA